jgi:hypothetical protein
MTILLLFIMMLYVTMVYGPIAAFLVELFPTRIRYTSVSLPYHIGNGWFGGMLPLLATAMVAASGDIYHGLWYPIVIAIITVVVGTLFLRETKDRSLEEEDLAFSRSSQPAATYNRQRPGAMRGTRGVFLGGEMRAARRRSETRRTAKAARSISPLVYCHVALRASAGFSTYAFQLTICRNSPVLYFDAMDDSGTGLIFDAMPAQPNCS